jgi:hypothetical protein
MRKTKTELQRELKESKASHEASIAQLEEERDEVQEQADKLRDDLKTSEQQRFEVTNAETHFRKRCTQLYALVGRLTCQLSELSPTARVLDVVPDPGTYEFPEDFQVSVRVNISPEAAKKIEADRKAAQRKAKKKTT